MGISENREDFEVKELARDARRASSLSKMSRLSQPLASNPRPTNRTHSKLLIHLQSPDKRVPAPEE
jgi:hypothetical protein